MANMASTMNEKTEQRHVKQKISINTQLCCAFAQTYEHKLA